MEERSVSEIEPSANLRIGHAPSVCLVTIGSGQVDDPKWERLSRPDSLDWPSVDDGKGGTQRLVAGDQFVQGALKWIELQCTSETAGDDDVVGPRHGFELIEEPESLLCERQRCFGHARPRNNRAPVRGHRGPLRTRCAATRGRGTPRRSSATAPTPPAGPIPSARAVPRSPARLEGAPSGAPKQRCVDQPKARWRLSPLRISSRSGSWKRCGSRFAAASTAITA